MFEEERARVSSILESEKKDADLVFAVVTDSHLDDYEEETLANIKAVDHRAHFDFLVHLGDMLNGNLPRNYTKHILKEEMERYRTAVQRGIFYPVQGNHDGFCNVSPVCTAPDMALEEDWCVATAFAAEYPNVRRGEQDPWFYADYPEQKVRLIVLASFSYQWTEKGEFQKLYELDPRQLEWLKTEALEVQADWTVMLFSHDGPLRYYAQEKYEEEPWNGNSRELMETVLCAKREKGFQVAAWFIGHWHGELCNIVEGIPFIIVGSQTCYIPQLWLMPEPGYYAPRRRGTVTQDLWDAVVWKKEKQELHLIRFGAGEDRIIHY